MLFLCCALGALLTVLPGIGVVSRAQVEPSTSAVLSGTVMDPSGARIRHARIHVHSDALDREIVANTTGSFSLPLPPGVYSLTANAPGFRTLSLDDLSLRAEEHRELSLRLTIAALPEEISVDPRAGSTNPADNRSAITFTGNQLQVLSNDPTTLRQQLLAMAGAGAGLGDAQFYVDGFSNSQLPPKAAIRSIRINSNPYSAEFDRAGFGRIDIETRAGGNKLHGSMDVSGTDDAFNARNPYTSTQPPYHQLFFDGNLNGPLDKKTTFFLAGNSTDLQNNAIVNAIDPSSSANATLSEAVPNPQRDDDYSLRLDRLLSASNTINGRYEIHRTQLSNAGVGLLVLPSEGYTSSTLVQTLQLDENIILSPKIVSDTRFQYIRTHLRQDPNDTSPTVLVEGAFSGGGAPSQMLRSHLDHYELQEDLAIDHGRHFFRAGGRYRLYRESNFSNAGYKGQFLYPDISAFRNHTPSQYTVTAGQPNASVRTADLGLYADDDWKLTRQFTLSLGFRYEAQSAIDDHTDPAPRAGFAWAIGPSKAKTPIVTLRGGAGIFYNRFEIANLLQAATQNGVTQKAYLVQNPAFSCTSSASGSFTGCTAPDPSSLPESQLTRYRVDPHLRTGYNVVTSVSAERVIGKMGSITANFLVGHGVHQYLSINANAPLPGTYNPSSPNSGIRPLDTTENIYQFTSNGLDYGRIFFSNFNLHPSRWLFLWAFYVTQHTDGDATSASAFASNSYNVRQDYGREDNNATQQIFCGSSWTLPHGLSLQQFLSAHSGHPFNITTGTDLNGDTIFNDRPAFATDLTLPSVVQTSFGNFDTKPQSTQTIIPYNYGHAPGFLWVDLQASEAFHVGPRPRAAASSAKTAASAGVVKPAANPERPWVLTFMVEAENPFNHRNPGPPVGVLGSPLFGRSLSLAGDFSTLSAANRSVALHASFTF